MTLILCITSICESTAETIVVVAVVVLSIVILSIVVLTISILPIVVLTISILTVVVAIVVLAVVVIVITAAATVVVSPTKEEPFVPSILPLCLSSLPASVAGAGSATGKEEPGLPIFSLPFATFAA